MKGDAAAAAAIAAEPIAEAITDASAAASQPKVRRLAVNAADADASSAAGDADADAAAGRSDDAAKPPTGRKGGRRASAAKKARATDAARAPPITPSSVSEVRLLAESLTKARAEKGAVGGMKVWRHAANLYLEGVTAAHLGVAPPVDLRNARTSAERIKAALESAHKGAQAVERERERVDGAAPAGDLLAELLAADDADDDANDAAAADDDGAKPAKRRKPPASDGDRAKRAKKKARGIVRGENGEAPRELKLSELRLAASASANTPKELTTALLKAYLGAAGRNPAKLPSENKVNFANELISLLTSEQASVMQWSPAAGDSGGLVFS